MPTPTPTHPLRHNIQRLREAVSWIPALGAWHLSLKAWERPAHNLASVPAAYALCFHTWVTLAVLAGVYLAVALRRLLRRVSGWQVVVVWGEGCVLSWVFYGRRGVAGEC
jgi:hypothetical protein